jgi:hypothetical protein
MLPRPEPRRFYAGPPAARAREPSRTVLDDGIASLSEARESLTSSTAGTLWRPERGREGACTLRTVVLVRRCTSGDGRRCGGRARRGRARCAAKRVRQRRRCRRRLKADRPPTPGGHRRRLGAAEASGAAPSLVGARPTGPHELRRQGPGRPRARAQRLGGRPCPGVAEFDTRARRYRRDLSRIRRIGAPRPVVRESRPLAPGGTMARQSGEGRGGVERDDLRAGRVLRSR